MNRSILIAFAILASGIQARGQFYYNDVVLNRQGNEKHQLYRKLKVMRITARSSAETGDPGAEPLTLEQSYNSSFSQLKTRTSANSSQSSQTNYYNAQGLLYRSVDSSVNVITQYEYQYEGDRLSALTSTGFTPGDSQKAVETHQWTFDARGCPVRMVRLRKGFDSSEVRFRCDEQGRVTEEQAFRKETGGEKIYYYHDTEGRVTDVVRYQDKLGKLIPDYTFDYNTEGQLSERMVVQNGGVDYLTWKYEYDAQGLPVRESCFSRQKKRIGTVEYRYEIKR